MSSPHVLAIPSPAQGHVIPLLELCQSLVKHGFRVTFVNTDYSHKKVVDALPENTSLGDEKIQFVSIPDGMEPSEDRNQLGKLCESMSRVMPGKLKELIEKIEKKGEKIDCVIADGFLGFVMQVAKEMNIRRAMFWPASTAILAVFFSIPQLIANGIINNEGSILKKEKIQLTPKMPATSSELLIWTSIGDLAAQKATFNHILKINEDVGLAQTMLCNSTYDLEQESLTLIPEILPVGPLLASNRLGTSAGSFWSEDETCLKWLDKQATNSVVYIAFGSFTVFEPIQFKELALGLALSNRPFLWAVRPDGDITYPEGFQEILVSQGCVTGWVPQQRVLSHPSIACFVSHCGWNSTMEGISNGVPFLCWPYFADQFLNESYICDVWKVGLRLEKNESGIIPSGEIKSKLDEVLNDGDFKSRSLSIKKMTLDSIREGGPSVRNLMNFIEWIKG